jgi:sporulation related protein
LLNKIAHRFEEWLLPRSRTLLFGLLTANVCVAFALIALQDPVETSASASLPVEREIQLLAEVAAPEATAQAQSPKPTPRECRVWGPEQNPEAFDPLITQLKSKGGFPEVLEQEVKVPTDFLVYVGALGSRDNAKRVAKELSALNIESYLINPEDAPPILSVGVFSRQNLADKQRKRVAGLGYKVFIDQLERTQTVYSLSAHVSADSHLYKSSTSACMAIAHNG